MLPRRFDIKNIGIGARSLALNLNRIENVHTLQTSVGVIDQDCFLCPTMPAYVYFVRPQGEHDRLIDIVRGFCNGKDKYDFFKFNEYKHRSGVGGCLQGRVHTSYQPINLDLKHIWQRAEILAEFEPFEDSEGNSLLTNGRQVKDYLERARQRKDLILEGFANLSALIVEKYIMEILGLNPNALPYQEK